MQKVATETPTKPGWRKRSRSSIGRACRCSTATKTASRTAPPISEPRISGLLQPAALPRSTPKTIRKSEDEKVSRPQTSVVVACGSRDSRIRVRATNSANAPTGTLTKKTQRQSSASVRIPPTSGPDATATPIVAPQTAIYALQTRCGGPVSNNSLAERLGVTAASASAMVKKLDGLGLVEHVPYRGVELTKSGRRVALEVLRHHRLLELYLSQSLGVPWDRVHDEAEVLEHHISEELEELIAAKLGNPTHDPHGDPIPTRDLVMEETPSIALSALEPGASGTFVRISDADPAMLRYLA